MPSPSPSDANPARLADWLAAAEADHADRLAEVGVGLIDQAAGLAQAEPALATRWVALAEHVLLGHGGDGDALRDWLLDLPDLAPGAEPALARARWACAVWAGEPAPELNPALAWRALQNVALAFALSGRPARARALLAEAEPDAAASPDEAARKAFAASANNVALHLRLALASPIGAPGSDAPGVPSADGANHTERVATMFAAAAIARRAWERAGTWVHVERAEYQLALCHAVAGDGEAARFHARACLAICESHGADAVERFYAEEALARAELAAGDAAAAAVARDRMVGWLAAVTDAETREGCGADLVGLAAPGGAAAP